MTALKLVPALALLMSGASLGQGATQQTKQNATSQKMAMDPKMHDQMMADTKKMDADIQALKKTLAEERTTSSDPAHHAEMMAQQKTSDQQIASLQVTVKSLRSQLDATPQYLEQKNASSP